jgi:DMSO/TMAO reductase YedYZ heme-binding membrane subunit
MRFLVGLLIAFIFAFLFRRPLKKAPIVFYLIVVALDALLIYGTYWGLPAWTWKTVMIPLQKNAIAFGLFTVVMFIGVLKDKSALHRYLMPIRAELSIVACLFSLGHVVVFINVFYQRLMFYPSTLSVFQILAVVCSVVFLVLMIPLLITSFKWVRQKINQRSWKRLQRLAYVFYGLLYLHVVLFLAPTLTTHSIATIVNVGAYTVVVALYAVLRVHRYRVDSSPLTLYEGDVQDT